MKILVMGGTGFIGLHLIEQLQRRNDEIILAVRKQSKISEKLKQSKISIVLIDYESDADIFQKTQGIDTLIFLIGQMGVSGLKYDDFYKVNCLLTKKVLIAAGKANVKHFIFCSTPGVLGFGKRLAKESEPYAPRNDYEKTKVIAEKYVIKFCRQAGMNYTILRPDFVYGPGDYRRIVMYRNIMKKRFILTTSGKSHLHPTYVDDVVSGFLCCIGNEHSYNEIFNIAADEDVTSEHYLRCIADATGSNLIHVNISYTLSVIIAGIIDGLCQKFRHKEGFVSKNKIDFLSIDHSSSIDKAKRMIGYKPQYNCQQGITKTIKWCKQNNLL